MFGIGALAASIALWVSFSTFQVVITNWILTRHQTVSVLVGSEVLKGP